jgi:hypothetical protein
MYQKFSKGFGINNKRNSVENKGLASEISRSFLRVSTKLRHYHHHHLAPAIFLCDFISCTQQWRPTWRVSANPEVEAGDFSKAYRGCMVPKVMKSGRRPSQTSSDRSGRTRVLQQKIVLKEGTRSVKWKPYTCSLSPAKRKNV